MHISAAIFTAMALVVGLVVPAAACPDNVCFQKHCWSQAISESSFLNAACEDTDSVAGWVWNKLDLDKCIGIEGNSLVWKENGQFSSKATNIRIEKRDFNDEESSVVLTAICQNSNGDRACSIILSDQIAIDGSQLSCFDEKAEIQSRALHSRQENISPSQFEHVGDARVTGDEAREDMTSRLAEQQVLDDDPPFDTYSCPDDKCFWRHCSSFSVSEGKNMGDSPIYFTAFCKSESEEKYYWNYLILDRCLANDKNWLVFEKDGNFQETCQEHTVEFLPPVDDDDTDPPFVIIQSDCRWVEGTMFYSSGSLSSGVWYNDGVLGCHDITAAWVPVDADTTEEEAWEIYQEKVAKGEIDEGKDIPNKEGTSDLGRNTEIR